MYKFMTRVKSRLDPIIILLTVAKVLIISGSCNLFGCPKSAYNDKQYAVR